MKRSSTYLFVSGAVALVFGLVAAFFPIATGITLVILWGIYALLDGIVAAVMAFNPRPDQSRGYLIFTAVVGILAGGIAVFSPVTAGLALLWVLGVWLILRGVIEIIAAFTQPQTAPRWLLVLGGVFWLLAGWLVLSAPDTAAALIIALWLGILAIVWGIVLITVGFLVRREANRVAPIEGEIVPPSDPTA
ncbi:HdeD family acid-resistance protein [Micropruina sp.]|uniref:HdeD family acid-resistance protein n=1 Tax=Micropruina sp. TaxID=2737536 RepID=UPI00261B1A78|nr:HdeD family acid-resistance protein [Micropruina sp.]